MWFAGPLDGVDVQPGQWWGYALVVSGVGVVAWIIRAVVKLILDAYRNVQVGDMVPRITVELMLAAKDAEIAHLQEEVARWVGNYHIKDAAYVSLAEIIDENTDAMRALATQPPPPPAIRPANSSEAPNARRGGRERA